VTRRGTLMSLIFRRLGPFIRGVLAATALLLIATFWGDTSWAQTKIARVGILNENTLPNWLSAMNFYQTLGEHGWVEGKNVIFEFRDSGGDPARLAEPTAELVRLKVDVLFPLGPAAVRTVFAATQTIPIIAHDLETDPVAAGYPQSYGRPGRDLTGLFLDSPDLAGKWLELLKAMVPRLSRVVVLWDATSGPVPTA
jgi:putative ABC transport system substrate-binding protein